MVLKVIFRGQSDISVGGCTQNGKGWTNNIRLNLEEQRKNDTASVMLARLNFDQKADLNISTNLYSASKRCIIGLNR